LLLGETDQAAKFIGGEIVRLLRDNLIDQAQRRRIIASGERLSRRIEPLVYLVVRR
jgi:hypothetical protein